MDNLDAETKKKLMQEVIANPNLIPADVLPFVKIARLTLKHFSLRKEKNL